MENPCAEREFGDIFCPPLHDSAAGGVCEVSMPLRVLRPQEFLAALRLNPFEMEPSAFGKQTPLPQELAHLFQAAPRSQQAVVNPMLLGERFLQRIYGSIVCTRHRLLLVTPNGFYLQERDAYDPLIERLRLNGQHEDAKWVSTIARYAPQLRKAILSSEAPLQVVIVGTSPAWLNRRHLNELDKAQSRFFWEHSCRGLAEFLASARLSEFHYVADHKRQFRALATDTEVFQQVIPVDAPGINQKCSVDWVARVPSVVN
jgi:hypothetical protein